MYDLEKMKALAAKGKISRRDFVQFALTAGVSVAAAETMFIKAARAAPKRGGHLRMGLAHGHTNDSLDPAYWADTSTQVMFWGNLSNSLTQVDDKGEIVLDLAESMDVGDDAKTWAFRLRKGVTFHDGKPLTPEDVLASYHHIMKEDSESPMKSVLGAVKEIKADGPDTVVFALAEGNADFPFLVSDYKAPILPVGADGLADWQSGNRTGAFKLESWEPGIVGRFVRNDNYHFEGRPYVDSCEVRALSDVTARTNALTTGEIDWMARPDLKTLDLLARTPDVEITEVAGYAHYVLPMLMDVAPFDDNNVRMAIKYAIDRQEILDKVFLGHATIGNDNPIPASVKFAIDPQPQHVYDPDKAKYYLGQSGLSSLTVDLHVANTAFDGAIDAGQLIRESAAKCGIEVNVVREPDDGYWTNVWGVKPWCASYWSGRPTADWMFTTAYQTGSSWNENHQAIAHFDELLIAGRAESDEKKRAAIYAELQQIVHDEGGQIVLVFNTMVAANSTRLAHDVIAGNWEVDGLRLAEKWWFA